MQISVSRERRACKYAGAPVASPGVSHVDCSARPSVFPAAIDQEAGIYVDGLDFARAWHRRDNGHLQRAVRGASESVSLPERRPHRATHNLQQGGWKGWRESEWRANQGPTAVKIGRASCRERV